MIGYILFIVFAGLMTLIALGLTVGGLMKKRRALWIGSLAAFVVFSMLTVYAGYVYAKKSLDYFGSEEFQEDTRKQAENWGQQLGNTISGAAEGLSKGLDDEAIAKLAKKSGYIIGKGVEALGQGVDETAIKTAVYSDQSIDQAGITIQRAERKAGNTYGLYLEFAQDFEGQLQLLAYDSEGLKKDRTQEELTVTAGTEGVYTFKFEHFRAGSGGYCILSKVDE